MIVRKKRSRVEAFPHEMVVKDGDKKNRCVLLASGVSTKELDPRLRDIITNRQLQRSAATKPDLALQRARDKVGNHRSQARDAAIKDSRTKIVEVQHETPGAFNERMDRAIWDAFQQGIFTDAIGIIRSGVNPNTQRMDGTTALVAACYHGNVEAVYELLNLGSDPDVQDANGNSPKVFARNFANPQIATQMLELLSQFDFVYDLYVVDAPADDSTLNQQPTFTLDSGATLCYDDATGRFLEYVHHEDDDFGRFEDEDSDSNESGYFERHVNDEGDEDDMDDDDDCEDGRCRLRRGRDDDDDDDDYI